MPEVDGFQAASALRSIKNFSRIPILAITAYPKSHWQDKAEDAGCDAFLQKPFTHELCQRAPHVGCEGAGYVQDPAMGRSARAEAHVSAAKDARSGSVNTCP